jgi:hypothetical protein
MPLFTDGNVASIEDLRDYESSVLQTANVEGIDITAKLKLAHRAIGFEIAGHLAQHGFKAPADLERVVVSPAILHWHCLHTLELIFRDAYNSQVNDRYLGKWKEYAQASIRARATATALGIGMVGSAISKAAAPVLATVAGGGLGTRAYYIAIAWQAANGSAGEQSQPVVISAPLSTLVRVTPVDAPSSATGWHVYAGESENELRRQNVLPLAPGSAWLEPASGLRSDLPAVTAQKPDWYVRTDRVLPRG